jgi:hypothetical protein
LVNEFGDFQTPIELVHEILRTLAQKHITWHHIIEPTCGVGNFLRGVLSNDSFNDLMSIQGIEIQENLAHVARKIPVQTTPLAIYHQNVFDTNFGDLARPLNGNILILGNPPWVTNSDLGVIHSTNLPNKHNIKGLSGLEAMTGSANFDIAESIWIKLLTELSPKKPTIALLCKLSTARNVLQYSYNHRIPVCSASIHKIDAQKWFNASVEACLLTIELGKVQQIEKVPIYVQLQNDTISYYWQFSNGVIHNETDSALDYLEGLSPYEWRQGIKHDLASVMELYSDADGYLWNKKGDFVDIEDDYVYPLLKSTDIFHQRTQATSKAVIVTQRKLNDDTQQLAISAPKLWTYLNRHHDLFGNRQSSIYKGKPEFAMFGVGEYTFAPYKAAISGFHKVPHFVLIKPIASKPVMLDDTCYFIAFDTLDEAEYAYQLFNHSDCLKYIEQHIFQDAKRPITKKLLQRINIQQIESATIFANPL